MTTGATRSLSGDTRPLAGPGMDLRRLCMGCNQSRPGAGGRGKDVRWRCAACVARTEAAKA